LLLDDVMSELDFERQEFLVKTLSDVQLFITTTEIPDILFQKFPHYRVYQVESGKISGFCLMNGSFVWQLSPFLGGNAGMPYPVCS